VTGAGDDDDGADDDAKLDRPAITAAPASAGQSKAARADSLRPRMVVCPPPFEPSEHFVESGQNKVWQFAAGMPPALIKGILKPSKPRAPSERAVLAPLLARGANSIERAGGSEALFYQRII
jgi:hypothetical protein